MAERENRSEISSNKRVIKLPPAIGDWTTYHPPKVLAKKVKSGLYGFDRLSQSELKTALKIHYRFAQQLFKSFKIDLGLGIEFHSIFAEQNAYSNFLRTISGPMVYGKVQIAVSHDPVLFILDINLANSLINHALGCQDLGILNRPFTDAEIEVLNLSISEYLKKLSATFEGILPSPTFLLVDSNQVAEINPVGSANTFISFTMEIVVGDNFPGKIMIGYPAKLLKSLVDKYNAKKRTQPINFGQLSQALLGKLKIPITVTLGETIINTADLRGLENGDIIKLDSSINSPALVKLTPLVTLLGQPGQQKNKLAVRIVGTEDQELELLPPTVEAAKEESPAEEEIKVEKELEETPSQEPAQEASETEEKEDLSDEFEEEDLEELEDEELADEEALDEDFGEEIEEEEKEEG